MKYLNWQEQAITDFSDKNISEMYEKGYIFTRIGKGVMNQTRSVRINLSKFEPSSENRRILNKNNHLELSKVELPLASYDWAVGKLAKDFYDKKFEPGIMSAQKIKVMLANKEDSNFNSLLIYKINGTSLGYTICYSNQKIIHYSYPFYSIDQVPKDMGLGMMLKAILWAKEKGLKYIYLGSLQRPSDTYKLQFKGLEWFDGKQWSDDIEKAKQTITQ